MSFVLDPNESAENRLTTSINDLEFALTHIRDFNLFEIKQIGTHPAALPKELEGRFTSSAEAYKAISSYVARKSAEKPKKVPNVIKD